MIRKILLSDLNEIYDIDQEVINSNWKLYHYENEINNKNNLVYAYILEAKLIAFIIVKKNYDDYEILQFGVKKAYHSLGYGHLLLEFIINEIKFKDIDEIFLEVKETNTKAYNFYLKHHFKVIHKRKNYYGIDKHAIIMKLKVEDYVNMRD